MSAGEARMVQTELWGEAGSAGAVLDREPGFQPTGGGARRPPRIPSEGVGAGLQEGTLHRKGSCRHHRAVTPWPGTVHVTEGRALIVAFR